MCEAYEISAARVERDDVVRGRCVALCDFRARPTAMKSLLNSVRAELVEALHFSSSGEKDSPLRLPAGQALRTGFDTLRANG
jgi:hypothetical protein